MTHSLRGPLNHHSPIVISILLAGLVQWRIWLLNNCPLKSLLTGMNRSKGLTTDQKQPKLIKNNRANLHLTDSGCVLLGHLPCGTMFRKSHLLSITPNKFDSSKQLPTQGWFFSWGTLITIRWSKNIQFRERIVEIPLPHIPNSAPCSTFAVTHAFCFTAAASNMQSHWAWTGQTLTPLLFTYSPQMYLSLSCA